jgi:hypothetical protein
LSISTSDEPFSFASLAAFAILAPNVWSRHLPLATVVHFSHQRPFGGLT